MLFECSGVGTLICVKQLAGGVNNLIRQSPRDGKRVLKDDYMCRRRGSDVNAREQG